MQYGHKVAMQRHNMQGYILLQHFENLQFTTFSFSYCFLMSFVCSWHLSQKELRLSTPLIPLLGEQVGVKEREQGWARDTETEREDKE